MHHLVAYLPTLSGLGKIATFMVMISMLILVHEYGHFFVARLNGVCIKAFALGMGPTLLQWTSPRSGTKYQFNLLPIGGYCSMKGEDEKKEANSAGTLVSVSSHSDSYPSKRPLQRLTIVLAGPAINMIAAAVLLVLSYSAIGVAEPTTTLDSVNPGKPADMAGLRAGDQITKIDGIPVKDGNDFIARIQTTPKNTLLISFIRNNQERTTKSTVVHGTDGIARIGFIAINRAHRLPLTESIPKSARAFVDFSVATLNALGDVVVHPKTAAQMQGIIGMGSMSGGFQDLGWGIYLQFAAIISLSLGIFNCLPLPALDGGRAAFIFLELLRGKPINQKIEAYIHIGGLGAILVMMAAISTHDIIRILSAHQQ